jgi:hypothetical protein
MTPSNNPRESKNQQLRKEQRELTHAELEGVSGGLIFKFNTVSITALTRGGHPDPLAG